MSAAETKGRFLWYDLLTTDVPAAQCRDPQGATFGLHELAAERG